MDCGKVRGWDDSGFLDRDEECRAKGGVKSSELVSLRTKETRTLGFGWPTHLSSEYGSCTFSTRNSPDSPIFFDTKRSCVGEKKGLKEVLDSGHVEVPKPRLQPTLITSKQHQPLAPPAKIPRAACCCSCQALNTARFKVLFVDGRPCCAVGERGGERMRSSLCVFRVRLVQ